MFIIYSLHASMDFPGFSGDPMVASGFSELLTLQGWVINSLPADRLLDQSKLKTFAADEIDVILRLKFAGYQHFLLFSLIVF